MGFLKKDRFLHVFKISSQFESARYVEKFGAVKPFDILTKKELYTVWATMSHLQPTKGEEVALEGMIVVVLEGQLDVYVEVTERMQDKLMDLNETIVNENNIQIDENYSIFTTVQIYAATAGDIFGHTQLMKLCPFTESEGLGGRGRLKVFCRTPRATLLVAKFKEFKHALGR